MTTEALKSTPITNLDTVPLVANTVGLGAPGHMRVVEGSITVTDGATSPSTYQLCRVPSNAKVKHVYVGVDTTVTTLTADLGWYYSTSTQDGTAAANQGVEIATDKGDYYGEAIDLKTAGFVDYSLKSAASNNAVIGSHRNKELWDALALASDPGGFFDLVATTTATNSGAAVINAEVQYVE